MDLLPLLSVIVPVYNEERTVTTLLERLTGGPYRYPELQVVVVDDGSRDRTAESLERWTDCPGVLVLRHPVNRGKGAAVRTGLAYARGTFTVIQDADLEYDPSDLPRLLEPLCRGQANVIYGSRYLARQDAAPWTCFRWAVYLMNWLHRLLYGRSLTDIATCYKAMRTSLYRQLDLQAERFELCAELTAKLSRLGERIEEVPISYRPRTKAEGKKIGWRDAGQYAWTLLKWRFARLPRLGAVAPRPAGSPWGGVMASRMSASEPDPFAGAMAPGRSQR
jgi:dolichol-phosphate mannosyltransferase